MGTVTKQLLGAPTSIKVGAYDAAEVDCTDVGFTGGDTIINNSTDLFDIKNEQKVGTLEKLITGRKMTVSFVLAEATLENLCLAMGYATTAVATNTFSIGGQSTVTNRTIYLNGPCDISGATLKVTLNKCVVIGAVEYKMSKTSETLFKVEVEVLEDTSKSAGAEYGTIVRSGTDTTPPTVAMTSPVEDGTVVAGALTALTLTFTEAGSGMDASTIIYGNADDATVFVNNTSAPTDTSLVAGTISYSAATKILTFTPTSAWATAGNNYSVMITTGVRDMAGNRLANVFYGHFVSA